MELGLGLELVDQVPGGSGLGAGLGFGIGTVLGLGLGLGDPAPGEQVDRGGAAVVLRLQHLVRVRARGAWAG